MSVSSFRAPSRFAAARRRYAQACLEFLEWRTLLSASLDPITDQTIPGGKTLFVPVTGATDQSSLYYTVQSDNPAVTATLVSVNSYLKLTIQGYGDMTFALLDTLAPATVDHITQLVNDGFYDGLTFHRVYPGFMIQAGSPNGDGTGGSDLGAIDDEFTSASIFSGDGQLAMANAGADTGDSQFFITTGTQRSLDFGYTIFGQLLRGFDVQDAILAAPLGPGNSDSIDTRPITPIVITSAAIITDTTDAVVQLTAPAGESATISVIVDDGNGATDVKTFTATSVTDTVNDRPFLHPIADQTTHMGTAIDIPVAYTDLEGDTNISYDSDLSNATASFSGNTLHIVPDSGFVGDITVTVGVHQGSGSFSTHAFTLHVTDAAPTLTTISVISGATQNTDFILTYDTLTAASNLADADTGDSLLFRVTAITNGTLKKNSIAVTAGSTTLGPGESLTWHSNAADYGNLNAFSVVGFDGGRASSTPVSVVIQTTRAVSLSTVQTLTGGIQNSPFVFTGAQFRAVTDATWLDGSNQKFLITSVESGTLKVNGQAVTPGTTTFGDNDNITWEPPAGATGLLSAFSVEATDGTHASASPVQVRMQYNARPTLTTPSPFSSGVQDTSYTLTYDALKAATSLADADTGQALLFRFDEILSGTLTKNGVPVTAGTTLGLGESVVWTPDSRAIGLQAAFRVSGWDGALASEAPVLVAIDVASRVTINTIGDQYFPGGKSLIVPITGTTTGSDSLTYSASSSDPAVTATILTGNIWIKMTVQGLGDMVFQLFNNFTPITAGRIATLIQQGFYNGLTFHRIITDFMAQGGDPSGDGTGGSGQQFDDEFNSNLIFSGFGQLAMANSGSDTNDSQFFITATDTRYLDYNHTIFGQLVRGQDVFQLLMARGSSNGTPTTQTVISSVVLVSDITDAVMLISGSANTSSSITVTATSAAGYTNTQTFTAAAQADTVDDPPFLSSIENLTGSIGTPISFTLPGVDVDGSAMTYDAAIIDNPAHATLTITGNTVTVVPAAGYTGRINIFVGVRATNPPTDYYGYPTRGSKTINSTNDLFDTQVITLDIPALLVYQNGTRIYTGQSTSIDFGAQLTAGTGPTRSFMIQNQSSDAVTLSNPVLPSGFSMVGDFPASVPAGGSVTFTIRLDTSAAGAKSGAFSFTTTDETATTFSFPLVGVVGQNFVRNLYRQLLRRDPDALGLNHWETQLRNNTLTSAQITDAIINSTEYRTIRITDLYSSILGRLPDQMGLNAWLAYFEAGGTVEQMAAGFYGSDEYFNTHSGNNAAVINALYRDLLGRDADSTGVSYWVSLIENGYPRDQIAHSILLSLEGRQRIVQGLYQRFLNRSAETAGLDYWTTQLANGQSETAIIAGFLNSNEFFLV